MPVARQPLAQCRSRPAYRRRQALEVPLVMVAEVAPVAAEQFVAADARQDHRHVAPRELRYQVGRDEGRVGERLVHVPEQPRQQRDHVGPHDDLVVLGLEKFRHAARIRELVVVLVRRCSLEADGVGAYRPVAVRGHEADHRARIDAA